MVHWSTASEHDASHFEVQRSSDGWIFEHIGSVNAAGNSAATTDYGFIDDEPMPGFSYYRLAQVDLGGQQAVTSAVVVDRNTRPREGPFPNPASDVAWWQLTKGSAIAEVIVVDAFGQVVLRIPRGSGDDRLIAVPVGMLPSAAYALMALDPDGSVMARTSLVKY